MIRAIAAALVACLVGGCAGYRLVRTGEVQEDVAAEIQESLVALRGLEFLEPVPLVAVGGREAASMIAREIELVFEDGELATQGRVYAVLGLLPQGTDLEQAMLSLYEHQLAGFYDPIERRMVVVTDALESSIVTRLFETVLRRDLTGELILAHELTHALQDQHFGLGGSRGEFGEDDANLARRAVYEGDATLAGYGVVLGGLSRRRAVALAGELEKLQDEVAKALPNVPEIIRDTVTFQYVAGVNFVSWAYRKAGWEGVNALLARPPRSTEQVLHPEKYFVKRENPLAIHVGALTPYMKSEWQLAEETSLGELVIQILGRRFFSPERAAAVAAGWDGDRFVAMVRGDDIALVWLTAWDSEDDAREFFAGYADLLAAKHGGGPAPDGDRLVVRGARPYLLERRNDKVLVIEGPLDPDLGDVARRVWRRSRYDAIVPWVPLDMAGDRRPSRLVARSR